MIVLTLNTAGLARSPGFLSKCYANPQLQKQHDSDVNILVWLCKKTIPDISLKADTGDQ